jgi:hypothetical protein
VAVSLKAILWRVLSTPYSPDPTLRTFLTRAQTQTGSDVEVTAAVLDAHEGDRLFGVPLARRGIQCVYLQIANHSAAPLRLQLVRVDANYYTPLEAAGVNHYSISKRLSAFGLIGWAFLPLLALIPFKLVSAWRANQRMDDFFRTQAFHLRPIPAGGVCSGFVFTPFDAGTKAVHVCLHVTGDTIDSLLQRMETIAAGGARQTPLDATSQSPSADSVDSAIEFTFSIPVPGMRADYLRRDFEKLLPSGSVEDCEVTRLAERLEKMPPATSNAHGTRSGDPVNLVVIGEFATLLGAFAARWDESETITLASCWRTVRSFLLGSQYRYSPVSPLFLFGRSQDLALQRTRRSINERLHLRLWLTPLSFRGRPVWVGQVSRDIGVRFTSKTWNLTTHRVDPDVDEARDYVIEDLLQAERIDAAGYVAGVGACDSAAPRHNLTGDPYFTDGKRVAVLLSLNRTAPQFVAWH